MGKRGRGRWGRRSAVWNEDLADAFLAVLRETGNAEAAARAVGHGNMFYKRRREDPGFARRWKEAVESVDSDLAERIGLAGSPFVTPGAESGESLEPPALPLPGEKAGGAPSEPLIRRNRAGRYQLVEPREGDWTAQIQANFLAILRRCGNFTAAARAVGFHFTTVYERMRNYPGFAADVDEVLREIDARLGFDLVAHANAVMRLPGDPRPEGEEEVPFDPAMAMKILSFLDARASGRTRRGRRKGPPERTFSQAVESILAKVEAIKRHRKLMEERAKREGDDAP